MCLHVCVCVCSAWQKSGRRKRHMSHSPAREEDNKRRCSYPAEFPVGKVHPSHTHTHTHTNTHTHTHTHTHLHVPQSVTTSVCEEVAIT